MKTVLNVIGLCIVGFLGGIGAVALYKRLPDQATEDQLCKMIIGSWEVGYKQGSVKCFDQAKFECDSINYSNLIINGLRKN